MLIRNNNNEQERIEPRKVTEVSIFQVWAQVHNKYGMPDILCEEYFATMEDAEMRLRQVKTYKRYGQTNDDGAYCLLDSKDGKTLGELALTGNWRYAYGIHEINPLTFADAGRVE
jgi:hypothetical protein